MTLSIKPGNDLTTDERTQINEVKATEFNLDAMAERELNDSLFFLIHDGDRTKAMGQLERVDPVHFGNETFSLMGMGGIIAIEKERGLGSQIVSAIKDFLARYGLLGIGFCLASRSYFYEKNGFQVNRDLIHRFVFIDEGEKITNSDDECVIIFDGSGNFSMLVSADAISDFILPRPPNW
ncbi:MAG: hypothetical protein ACRDFQ_00035 [Anaerolineales bacterium]